MVALPTGSLARAVAELVERDTKETKSKHRVSRVVDTW